MKRRKAIQTIGGLSLLGLNPVSEYEPVAGDSTPNLKEVKTDVLVVGGGTAGVVAAIQAGRAGCSTILVENGSQLGGTMTTAGVSFPGLFHAWGKQVIRGIGWELIMDTVLLDNGELPDFTIPTGRQHWRHQIRINPNIYVLLAEEKCTEAGVKIRYYETPVKAEFRNNSWEVETMGKGTHTRIICNQVIDCTGNAYLTALAGLNVLREEDTQPGTQMFRIEGYDVESLDLNIIQERFKKEVEKGNLLYSDARGNIGGILRTHGDNSQHVLNADSTTSETHSDSNIRGRASILRLLRFLKQFPGCENIHLAHINPEVGVRETFRIDGVYQVSHKDYISGRKFDDSLAYSFYPIDLHDPNGIVPKHLEEGVVPTIPLRALIPKNSRNFLVAGRCISSDRLANSALRVQASCMAMGQMAAAAAALAFKNKTTPLDLSINELKSLITDHGGIVPS